MFKNFQKLAVSVKEIVPIAEAYAKQINVKKFAVAVKSYTSQSIQNLPEDEKTRILKWIFEVRTIRNSDKEVSRKEKEIETLAASTLMTDLLKSHLASVVDKNTFASKETARMVIDGASYFIRINPFSVPGVVGFSLKKIFPKILLLSQAEFIFDEIEAALK